MRHANYIINRTACSPGTSITRYETHTGKKYDVNLDWIHMFGQLSYIFIPHKHQQGKNTARAQRAIWVGIDERKIFEKMSFG